MDRLNDPPTWLEVATTQEIDLQPWAPRQWTSTTTRWRCGLILLPSLTLRSPHPQGEVISEVVIIYCWSNNEKNNNKANLRDLIAAAGLVTLFGHSNLEIVWMTVKNNHLQMLKPDPYLRFSVCVTLKFDKWSSKKNCIQESSNWLRRSKSLISSFSIHLISYISHEQT